MFSDHIKSFYRPFSVFPPKKCRTSDTSLRPLQLLLVYLLISSFLLASCQHQNAPEKTDSLDFTVVAGTDIPEDLAELIKTRQKEPFELTYCDNSCLYIVKGFGKQNDGGYHIVVNDFYQAADCLVFDAELFGPKEGESVSGKPSYPYIVIKTEYREDPVTFL